MIGFIDWLYATPLSEFLKAVTWIIPIVQSIHILCMAVLFTSMMMLDFRLLSLTGKRHTVELLAQRFLPVVWFILPILLVTGLILIIAEPKRDLANLAFYTKMTMLLISIALTWALQRGIKQNPSAWEMGGARAGLGKAIAALSILLWVGIVLAGRLIAYV